MPTRGTIDPQDGDHNEGIGDADQKKGDGEFSNTHSKEDGLLDMCIAACQLQYSGNITEEVIDLTSATEWHAEGKDSYLQSTEETKHQGPRYKAHRDWPTHNEGVAQWVADSHISVIGHDSQQEAISTAQKDEEEHLGATVSKGDGDLYPRQDAGQGQWGDGTRIAEFHCCQVGQEKVHGGVEGAVKVDNKHDGGISTEAEQIQKKEGHKNQ